MTNVKLPRLHSDFSVDCAIFGIDEGELKILLMERNERPFKKWKALPGNLVYDTEDIEGAAERVLYETTGLHKIYLEQFYCFGKIDRHPQGRVITVAYYSLIKTADASLHPITSFAKKAFWCPVDNLPQLAFDHKEIVQKALTILRHKIQYEPIGFELLPEKFTLTQLQHVYHAILETEMDKRNFRKKILSSGLLIELKDKQKGVAHRAARYYKFNKPRYERLKEKGFNFSL